MFFLPKVLIFVCFLVAIYLFFYWLRQPQNIEEGQYILRATVIKTSSKYAILNVQNTNFLIYLNKFTTKTPLRVSQIVDVEGSVVKINEISNFHIANSINYLINKGNVIRVSQAKYSFNAFVDNYSQSGGVFFNKYWKLLLFGKNYDSESIVEKAIKINIVHLIVISGLHFDLLFTILLKPLSKIKNIKVQKSLEVVAYIFIFMYLASLQNFIPGIRAFITQICSRKFKLKFSQSIIIAAFCVFFLNFNNIITISFILSFSCTILIVYLGRLLKKFKIKYKILQYLILITCIYIYMSLFSLSFNKYLNLLGLFYTIIFTPIIELVYIFSLIFCYSPSFLDLIYQGLDWLINFASTLSVILLIPIKITQKTLLIWMILWASFISIGLFYRGKRKNKKI